MKVPSNITLNKNKTQLTICFDNKYYVLSAEYLRVYSPSAEVRGHSPDQSVLQVGKEKITISAIDPVGNYAIKITFSDGHDSGLYSWQELYRLATNYDHLWQDYLARLDAAGHLRLVD